MYYTKGVFVGTDCVGAINHAVQAVGYGFSSGYQYAILRNQWGSNWGEDGYMRIALDNTVDGPCGLYSYPLTTVVD